MTKQDIAKKLIRSMQSSTSSLLPSFGSTLGAVPQIAGVSEQVDTYLRAWFENGDDAAVFSAIELLETVTLLSSEEADQLRQAVQSLSS